jgi:hypothetical protein
MKYLVLLIYAAMFTPAASSAQHDLANTGIIETTIDVSRYPCFDVYDERPRQTQYVIRSGDDYLAYQESVGKSCDFPEIDFTKHTLLGMFGGGNNYCSVEYFRNVTNDKTNGVYLFTLNVLEKGYCKRAVRWHWHWVLVPKLPESYEVAYKVNRIREKDLAEQPKKSEAATQSSKSNPCKTITKSVSTPGQNSVSGKIVAGPNRPVNIDGDNSDPYSPIQASVAVKRSADNKEVARFKSDVNGEFRVSLRPGDYTFEPLPVNRKAWPRPRPACAVTVQANHSLEIRIEYDTGIR